MRLADRVVTETLSLDTTATTRRATLDDRTAQVLESYGVRIEQTDTGIVVTSGESRNVRAAVRELELERHGLNKAITVTDREYRQTTRRYQGAIARWLAEVPVVAASNVHRWWQTNDVSPEDSVLVPRWPSFWVEYPVDRSTQVGVMARSVENDDPDADDRWTWDLDVFVGDPAGVRGPTSTWRAVADRYGRLLHLDPESGDPMVAPSAIPVWAATLSLANCKNVEAVCHEPSPGEQRKHRRKRGATIPLVGYHVIKVDVGRASTGSAVTGNGTEDAFHICAGCLAHYGDCCPGTHPPHGELFGRHTGRFFRPAHARGNRSVGVRVSDYEIVGVR